MKTMKRLLAGSVTALLCISCLLTTVFATEVNGSTIAIKGFDFAASKNEEAVEIDDSIVARHSTEGGGTSVLFDGSDTFTLSATSSTFRKEGSFFSIKYYAQNYKAMLTLKNSSDRTAVIIYTTSGIDGGDVTQKEITLLNGESKSFSVTTNVTNSEQDTSTTVKGTVTINKIAGVSVEVSFASSPHGSYSYTLAGGSTVEMTAGAATAGAFSAEEKSTITLKSGTADNGYSFYGWMADGRLLSTDAEYVHPADVTTTIYPVYLPTGTVTDGAFKVGSNTYLFWHQAVADAKTSGNAIVLARDYTLPATLEENGLLDGHPYGDYVKVVDGKLTYVVPEGVTFLVPYYDTQTKSEGTEPSYVETAETQSAFRTLTMASGANVLVNGTFEVGGKCLTGTAWDSYRTTGQYGYIAMSDNSSITVNGTLYAWGYITGSGNVVANSGAVVYEFIQIRDWRGGTKTSAMKGNDNKVFPFSQYYVQNIEAPLTIHSGAAEKISMVATASGASTRVMTSFVASDGMFQLGEGAALTRRYSPVEDRMIYTIEGIAFLSGITVEASLKIGIIPLGEISVVSSEYNFPVTSNMTINLATGSTVKVDEAQSLAMLPGAEINIDNGAELVVSSSVYVYDADQWDQTYLWAANQGWTHPVVYSPTRPSSTKRAIADAKIDVNGTLTVNGQLYTTAAKDDAGNIVGGGANITSSEGTGKVVLNTALTESGKTYQYDQTNEKYVEIPVTPAKLKNTNAIYADYTETARTQSGDVFTYHDGVWGSAVIVEATDGYTGGYANLDRAIEYFPTDSTGSTYIKMIGDSTEPRATSVTGKNVYLDLYGKRVELAEGGLTISGTDADGKAYSLYGFDTSGGYTIDADHAATYTAPKGKIVGTVSGLAKTYQTPTATDKSFQRYVAITENGTTTFHRFNISVTGFHVLLSWQADSKSYAATIFYHATARGDSAVQNAVSGIGFDLDGKQYSAEKKFDTEVDSTIGWGGIVDSTNVNTLYGATAYLKFGDDTQESEKQEITLLSALVYAYNSNNLKMYNESGASLNAKTILNQAMKSLGDTIWSNWQTATGQSAA